MKIHCLRHARFIVFAVFALVSETVVAQSYPAKLIRMVVPFPAGGGVDVVIRIISPKLSENLGQPIIIDNRSGATGNIGTEMAAKAAPDGYTLLGTYSSFAMNVALYTKLPFDAVNDFAPITLLAVTPSLLVVNPSMPVRTVNELIALAKKHPGEILYASSGSGGSAHLTMELFIMMSGIKMTHVPYKGGLAASTAVISGESQATFLTLDITLQHVKSGRLRAIAVSSLKRFKLLPDIPTIDESGLRGYETNAWYALLAPAKTSQPIIEQLHRETVKVLQRADTRESFLQQGLEAVISTPEQLAMLIKSDIEKWSRVVKATGAKVD